MPKKRDPNCSWSEPATLEFLHLLVEFTTEKVGVKPPTATYLQWVGILKAKHNHKCTVEQLRTKYQRFRSNYGYMRAIKTDSGLGWDEEKQCVQVEDFQWERYCNVSFLLS